jgi:hypothetical protein
MTAPASLTKVVFKLTELKANVALTGGNDNALILTEDHGSQH